MMRIPFCGSTFADTPNSCDGACLYEPKGACGGWEGDLIDQANTDAEAELQIASKKPTLSYWWRCSRRSVASKTGRMAYARTVISLFAERGWKQYLGPDLAGRAWKRGTVD
jgi:hypothetical protein